MGRHGGHSEERSGCGIERAVNKSGGRHGRQPSVHIHSLQWSDAHECSPPIAEAIALVSTKQCQFKPGNQDFNIQDLV